ncbi:hypothetical protein M885DRAFT_622394 [Pelagophyceae sp. CCMP2097]|nr:hypothetical protein M885DRAFT_622394 [Pelagophyceae sp. CCMP2097]
MTAAPVTPFDEGQFREAGLRWTGDEMDQDGHLPDYGYMMLDDFTRLVEAALYGTVAAVVFTNTRGKAFFMGDVDGLGLVIGTPSHLAAFVTNAPTCNQIIADIARFAMKNLQNYKCPSRLTALRWLALGLDVHYLDLICLDLIVPMLSDGVVADPALDVVVPRLDLPCCGTGMLLR